MTQQPLITRLKAVEEALDRISRLCKKQLDLIGDRVPGQYIDKIPVIRAINQHKSYADAALPDLHELIKESEGQDPVGIIDGNTSAYIWKKLPHETIPYTALGEKP